MAGRKPYARNARGKLLGWYVFWEGRQTWLGRFEGEAKENFERLKAGKPVIRPERAEKLSSAPTVTELIDAYIDHRRRTGTSQTLTWYMGFLRPLVLEFGHLKASALKVSALESWINGRTTWGDNMRYGCGRAILAVMHHAVENDLIADNPLKKFKKVRPVAREDAEFDNVEWSRLREAVRGWDFEDALLFMRLTGCRPLECRSIEARHFQRGLIVFAKAEAKGKRHERIIYLTPEAFAIIERLVALYPTGSLFRDSGGRTWTQAAFSRRCNKLAKLCNVPQLLPYSARHSYATESVIAGVDSLVLMKLMGHASTKQLEKVYAKHGKRVDFMLEQAGRGVCVSNVGGFFWIFAGRVGRMVFMSSRRT